MSSIISNSPSVPAGYSRIPLDCNDADPTTYPGAPDPCNDGIDQNCDGNF